MSKINSLFMRTNIFIILLVIASNYSFAQKIDIELNGGMVLGGYIVYPEGKMDFSNSVSVGFKTNYKLNETNALFVDYLLQPTNMDVWHSSILGADSENYKLQMHWMQLGYTRDLDFENLSPYASISAGITNFNPQTPKLNNATMFSMTLAVGTKFHISEKLGAIIYAKYLLPIGWQNVIFDTGNQQQMNFIKEESNVSQFNIGVGLTYSL